MNFHFILIEMCIFMGICVWTGSSHCFMTQCTIRTVCLTPRVTMQGYESQKCEISINHNLTRLTKHKTVNCSPDDWKSDQDNTRSSHDHLDSVSVCSLLCLTIVTWPLWPRYGQVTPALSTEHPPHNWSSATPGHWLGPRGSETTSSSSYVESSNPHPHWVNEWAFKHFKPF